jgi:hypothetical protein
MDEILVRGEHVGVLLLEHKGGYLMSLFVCPILFIIFKHISNYKCSYDLSFALVENQNFLRVKV